MERLILKG